ncbi:DNA glycosylase [Daldinia eschscholtzii]|nr:DNA glycosylase [Daldinia eschscholtzii]
MRRSSRRIQQSGSNLTKEKDKPKPLSVIKNEEVLQTSIPPQKSRIKKRAAQPQSDEEYVEQDFPAEAPRSKRQKVGVHSGKKNGHATAQLHARLFSKGNSVLNDLTTGNTNINLPIRAHGLYYHRPLLLDNRQTRTSLLTWFDSVSSSREMPWRKPWVDPTTVTPEEVERRAYQVWISEIMLQQTRVSTVVDYWNRWMARWPTIQDLAAAEPDEVLSAWRGLGYYSRATRIHDAARIVCKDPELKGLLPSDVDELVAKVPGVGRYTAGAISAIVFGKAAPMVDGNVLRVLSRQLGVFGDVKADKAVIDLLWAAADSLVKAVARDKPQDEQHGVDSDDNTEKDDEEVEPSNRPGRWGQALMELGSTICAPKPNCAICPITSSCRAYEEGVQLATKRGLVAKSTTTPSSATLDIEDACTLCKPFEEYADEDDNNDDERNVKKEEPKQQKSKPKTQTTLRSFAFTQVTSKTNKTSDNPKPSPPPSSSPALSSAAVEAVVSHARKFPLRTVKKAVREEETLVCAIRRTGDGRYLIRKRTEKGLLAGLWELPSCVLEEPQKASPKTRKKDAEKFARGLVGAGAAGGKRKEKGEAAVVKYMDELGSVPWLFSHLKLTMHVYLFELEGESSNEGEEFSGSNGVRSRWCDVDAIDAESMGTGMRKCWALVKEAG